MRDGGCCCLVRRHGGDFSNGMAILPVGGYMRFWKQLSMFFVCLIFSALSSSGVARSEVVDRIVATVNGEIILYSEVQEQLKVMEKLAPAEFKTLDPQKKGQVERDILNQLIRQRLTEAEVKRLKITITNPEVDQAVEGMMQDNHLTKTQFESALKEQGQSLDKFRDNIKKELERNRLLERVLKMKTVITDEQVEASLKGGQADVLNGPKKIHLGIILLPADEKSNKDVEKTGLEIIEKLKGGADFKKLATQFSKGPAAADGGDIGFMAPDELAPFISDAIKNFKGGEVSGLVRGQGGYYILKVFEIDREKPNKSDPSVREKVRRELFQKEVNRKFEEWVRNLESKAFIQNTL
jgi:peptidyl-prolyl cis-trans isomerase SurA